MFKKHLPSIEKMQYMAYSFNKKTKQLDLSLSIATVSNILQCFGVKTRLPEREKPQVLRDIQRAFSQYGDIPVDISTVHCVLRHEPGNIQVVATDQTRPKDVRIIKKLNRDLDIFVNPRYLRDAQSWGVLEKDSVKP